MRCALLLLGLLLVLPARAQPLSTDRPDFTEAAVSVQHSQIEFGTTATRAAGTTAYTIGEVLLRLPLAPRLEARIQGGLGRGDGQTTATDVAVGAKLAFREGSPAFAAMGMVGLSALTGDARVEGARGVLKLLGSVDVAPGVALASNVGVTALRDTPELSASLSLGADLAPRLGAYVEGFLLHETSPAPQCIGDVCGSEPELRPFVNVGLTFRPVPTFQLDARIGAGHGRTVFAGVGASARF